MNHVDPYCHNEFLIGTTTFVNILILCLTLPQNIVLILLQIVLIFE